MKHGILTSLLFLVLVISESVALDEGKPTRPRKTSPSSSLLSATLLRGGVQPVGLPTERHQKDAGAGYQSGSPLYNKQQKMKADGTLKAPPPPPGSEKARGQKSLNGHVKDATNKDKQLQNWKDNLLNALIGGLITAVITLIFAFLYKKFRTGPPKVLQDKYEPRKSWQYGLCEPRDCAGEDWKLCCISFFCLPIRWADTISNEKVKGRGLGLGYWPAVCIVVFLNFLSYFTGGLSMCCLLGLQTYYRGVIRKTFGHNSGAGAIACDCVLWCCCKPCVTCQEAREVEQVRHSLSVLDAAKDAAAGVAGQMVRTTMTGTTG